MVKFNKTFFFALVVAFLFTTVKAETASLSCPPVLEKNSSTAFDTLGSQKISKILGWVNDPQSKNICRGYYTEPDFIVANPIPVPIDGSPFEVAATKPAFFTQGGTSVLQGDVKFTQKGREITADNVTFYRDNKTGKLNSGVLMGNVHYRESGKLIVAEQGNLDFVNKIHTLNDAVYRLVTKTPTGFTNVWGRAKRAMRNAIGILKFNNGTYSTCPPDNESWHLWSKNLTLDKYTGKGVATNSLLYVKNIPVLYTPYFSFPIDNRRKSGFLFPGFTHTSGGSGTDYGVSVPYYFNLAPNYDATITPELFKKRGVLLDGGFNYLTAKSNGTVDISYIPHDSVFAHFRDSTFSPTGPALDALHKDSDGRGYISMQDQNSLNQHWTSALNVNYTTDDYFLQDFGLNSDEVVNSQLVNEADLNYSGEIWRFLGRLQGVQTLHPITQTQVPDQYRRLPQLDLIGDKPNGLGGLDYQLSTEVVNFDKLNDFYTGVPAVAGGRFNIQPGISMPIKRMAGYITPQVQLQATNYSLYHVSAGTPNEDTRVIPLVSIDSGMYFSRNTSFFGTAYTQTLEPRLFYLYVPNVYQDNLPLFDTNLPPLDFNQIFRVNRFSGIDRVGDANQVTVGLTTRFLDDFGQEKLNAGLGQVLLFSKHHVTIPTTNADGTSTDSTPDPMVNEQLSPLIGQLQYYINSNWNASAGLAWDPNYHKLNNTTENVQYVNGSQSVVNLWYNYTLNGDPPPVGITGSSNLNRVGASAAWTILQKWNVVGAWGYNVSHVHSQNYLYGLEYDSCCWALRVVQNKTFIGIDSNNQKSYSSTVYVQFMLKGLGSIGSGGGLAGLIPGYQDKFVTGFGT